MLTPRQSARSPADRSTAPSRQSASALPSPDRRRRRQRQRIGSVPPPMPRLCLWRPRCRVRPLARPECRPPRFAHWQAPHESCAALQARCWSAENRHRSNHRSAPLPGNGTAARRLDRQAGRRAVAAGSYQAAASEGARRRSYGQEINRRRNALAREQRWRNSHQPTLSTACNLLSTIIIFWRLYSRFFAR